MRAVHRCHVLSEDDDVNARIRRTRFTAHVFSAGFRTRAKRSSDALISLQFVRTIRVSIISRTASRVRKRRKIFRRRRRTLHRPGGNRLFSHERIIINGAFFSP